MASGPAPDDRWGPVALPSHTVERPEPGVAALRRLHVLSQGVSGDLDLDRTLRSICRGVVDGLGFGVAVVNLVLPDGDLEVVACAGDEDAAAALLGQRGKRADWDEYLAACRPAGELLFDYRLREDVEEVPTWLPGGAARTEGEGEAWDPRDALLALLRTPRSGLLGVLSVDLPEDGCRPGPAHLELLERYAAQASDRPGERLPAHPAGGSRAPSQRQPTCCAWPRSSTTRRSPSWSRTSAAT